MAIQNIYHNKNEYKFWKLNHIIQQSYPTPANTIRQLRRGNTDIWWTWVKPSILTGFAFFCFKCKEKRPSSAPINITYNIGNQINTYSKTSSLSSVM